MIYRETGQFKTTYRADQQVFVECKVDAGIRLVAGNTRNVSAAVQVV